MKNDKIWVYYKSSAGLGWAVFNNKYKYVSHYEENEIQAFRICAKWNREKREF